MRRRSCGFWSAAVLDAGQPTVFRYIRERSLLVAPQSTDVDAFLSTLISRITDAPLLRNHPDRAARTAQGAARARACRRLAGSCAMASRACLRSSCHACAATNSTAPRSRQSCRLPSTGVPPATARSAGYARSRRSTPSRPTAADRRSIPGPDPSPQDHTCRAVARGARPNADGRRCSRPVFPRAAHRFRSPARNRNRA